MSYRFETISAFDKYKSMNVINPYVFGGFHPAAVSYITAAGLIGSMATLWDDFVKGCIADDVWNYIDAIWPFMGGNASSHKFNAKNPIDADSAFRLIFYGTSVHDSNGYENTSNTSYANTFYNELTHGLDYDTHLLLYLNKKTNTNGAVWGCATGSPARRNIVYVNLAGIADIADFYTGTEGTGRIRFDSGATNKYNMLFTRTSSTHGAIFKNSIKIKDLVDNASGTTRPNEVNSLGGRNSAGTIGEVQPCVFRFVCKGRGLSDAKAIALQNRVQTLQIGLGRNLY